MLWSLGGETRFLLAKGAGVNSLVSQHGWEVHFVSADREAWGLGSHRELSMAREEYPSVDPKLLPRIPQDPRKLS